MSPVENCPILIPAAIHDDIIFVKSKLHILPGGEEFKDDQQPEIIGIHPGQSGDMLEYFWMMSLRHG